MRWLVVAFAFSATAGPAAAADDYPHVYLKNDKLKVKVYLPDAEKGFYRGTRFDRAGVFGEIEFAGHKIFGPWKDTHDPTNHDDIVGPCEEFGMDDPLGYESAKVGDTFLKIGVGELVKPKEEKYRFFHNYTIARPGTWTVSATPAEVTFVQIVSAANGYAYGYTKRVQLVPGKAAFRLTHEFTNRSADKPIDTTVYNHNFFNVDADTVGPNYAIEFPFAPSAVKPVERFNELVKFDRRRLTLTGLLDKGSIYAGLTGWDAASGDYRFAVSHKPSGLTMRVTGTGPLAKFNLWAVGSCLCPEPYIRVSAKPGEAVKWETLYEFE